MEKRHRQKKTTTWSPTTEKTLEDLQKHPVIWRLKWQPVFSESPWRKTRTKTKAHEKWLESDTKTFPFCVKKRISRGFHPQSVFPGEWNFQFNSSKKTSKHSPYQKKSENKSKQKGMSQWKWWKWWIILSKQGGWIFTILFLPTPTKK